jgi:hypothetical protein
MSSVAPTAKSLVEVLLFTGAESSFDSHRAILGMCNHNILVVAAQEANVRFMQLSQVQTPRLHEQAFPNMIEEYARTGVSNSSRP